MSDFGAQPTIDVIIPVYRHLNFVEQAVRSAIQPGISRVLVHDDGTSSPKMDHVLRELQSNSEAVSVTASRETSGIASTQNMLIERSKADFVAFLDCDDYLSPFAGSRVQRALSEGGTDYLFTDRMELVADPDSADIRSTDHGLVRFGGMHRRMFDKDWNLLLLDGMFASHLKVVRRDLIMSLGGLKSEADGFQDWEFALAAIGSASFKYLPDPLYFHRIHLGQETNRARTKKLQA